MKEIPGTPIYCTANGIKSLKGHYHLDWNFVQVKTGEDCGFDVLEEGLGVLWKPDESALELCRDYGTQLANKL